MMSLWMSNPEKLCLRKMERDDGIHYSLELGDGMNFILVHFNNLNNVAAAHTQLGNAIEATREAVAYSSKLPHDA